MPNRVVDFAALGRLVTTGVGTVSIAGDDGSSDVVRDDAVGATDVKNLPVWPEYDASDIAVAGYSI